MKVDIERINFLANKAKTEGLTDAEKEEQALLRKQYLDNFKQAFKKQITNIKVVDPEGNDVTPDKVKQIKANKDLQ